ncbi:MAG TPA: GlsB/YeaQ/YmgE family stress response membrane protein, partial [Gemmatimonadaceae bacterium]
MGIIAWIVLGLIAGLIAKAIMPGKDPGGFIITT